MILGNLIKKDGFNFAFDPSGCDSCKGNCCVGESGYIWINSQEIEALALYKKISSEDLKIRYLNKITYKYSIKEIQLAPNNYACCFFDLDKRQCLFMMLDQISVELSPFGTILKKMKKRFIKSVQL